MCRAACCLPRAMLQHSAGHTHTDTHTVSRRAFTLKHSPEAATLVSCSDPSSRVSVEVTMATGAQGNQGRWRFGPGERLTAVFRACSRDPTEAIERRLSCMLRTFLQHHRDTAGSENTNDLATRCCCAAVIWYYRILESIVSQERKRVSDILVILEKDLFQCCLVACCLEITISSNRLPCDFPLLLQVLKLPPYHFLKVIEPVLRAETYLPRAVFRHLAQVEDKVLESLAWTSDSPLWGDIRANGGHLPTCQQVMPRTKLEGPKGTDFHPDRNQPGVDLSLGAEPSDRQHPSAVNRPLHLFARKVYNLMGKRLRQLCSTLDISEELRLKIWTCFEHSLVNCTELMVDRNLDQLLMCAIYIIAKITKVEIPFKRIMNCYMAQPLASKSVCKNVLISGKDIETSLTGDNHNGAPVVSTLTPDTPSSHYPTPCQEKRGNLILFYNQTYTQKMEQFATQFSPTSGADTPPVSPYPRQQKASPRRQQLSSSPSIFISPHNTDTTPPTTAGLCYYFNSSPPECLREINNMIRTGRSPSRRCRVVSLNREEEDEEDGPSAKRLRVNGQSAWEKRLRNVVNNRVTRRDQDRHTPVTRPTLH